MSKRLRLSASKITTYKGCPLAYYMRYIAHEIVPEDVRLAFGKVVHAMLDDFYDKNFKSAESFAGAFKFRWFRHCSGETLTDKMKEHFKIIAYPTKKEPIMLGTHIKFYNPRQNESEEKVKKKTLGIFFGYMKIGENIMKRFYEEYKNRPDPIIREQPFDIYIAGHPTRNNIRRKHHIRVIFDRVDEKDGHIAISDYKTDSGDPADKSFSIHRHPQFTIYSLTLRQLIEEGRISFPCGKKEESVILYHHLRSGKILETHRSETDFDYLRSLLDDVHDGITNDRFTPFYGFHCNMCDYQRACEKYSTSYGGPKIIDASGNIKQAHEINWDDDFNNFLRNKEIKPRLEQGQLMLQFEQEPLKSAEKGELFKQKSLRFKSS